jgi:hypothetical protein
MSHITTSSGTPVLPATPGAAPQRFPAARAPLRHLDHDLLRAGIAVRRRRLETLEAAMVAACERAAAISKASNVRMDDRETWDRTTWRRYLDAAARLEPEFGPPMRRLLQEIDQLARLLALPLGGKTLAR